jgi:hypothetical protein
VLVTIVLLLLGTAALAYAAWSRGMLALPAPVEDLLAGWDAAPLPQLPGRESGAVQSVPAAPTQAETLLDNLDTLPPRQLRPLREAIEGLAARQARLDALEAEAAPGEADATARDAQLAKLKELLPELIADYNAFEDAAARVPDGTSEEGIAALRSEFATQLGRYVDLLGRCYLTDPNVARNEYSLGEQLQQAVSLRGKLSADELKQHWLAAVKAREQRQLDARFTAEYEALGARIATLHELRRKFNDAAAALPPPSVNRGHIGTGTAGLLTLYDSFAYKLEQLWDDWVVVEATLPPVSERPDRMEAEVKEIRETFFSEHLDCFTQIYKIYATDADLEHEAYQHVVDDHYEFVKAEWPNRVGAYMETYHSYEAEWDRNFRQRDDSPASGASGGGIDLQGPPGYSPPEPPAGNS